MDDKTALLSQIDRLHTTDMGAERIKKNLGLTCTDAVAYCMGVITDERSAVYRNGKNYYCELENIRLTVNAGSYTIITAHIIK
ncbi:MAG: DUF3781 domain-containing protein [Ruminococcus sp.]|nr:DUF3781 domain-containing protein [Ruminococcus sp.]